MESLKLKVLIIDDNPADAQLVRRLLSKAPRMEVECIHCLGAEAGQELIATGTIDCVFLDYHLGEKSGLDVLVSIRKAGNDIPVIALTGQGNEELAIEALRVGAQDYIAKTVMTPEALGRAVVNAINKVGLERQLADKHQQLERFVSVIVNEFGSAALLGSAGRGLTDAVQVLLAGGVAVDGRDKQGSTALMLAASEGRADVVGLLLAAGASGSTPLMLAALRGRSEAANALLANNADPNISEKNGVTPLMAAAVGGHLGPIDALLNHGAELNATNRDGSSALSFALSKGRIEAAKLLITRGAQVTDRDEKALARLAVPGPVAAKPIRAIESDL